MRRLAKQDRKDTYASERDYQTIEEKRAIRLTPRGEGDAKLVATAPLEETTNDTSRFVVLAGYVRPSRSTSIGVLVEYGDQRVVETICKLGERWSRVWVGFEDDGAAGELQITTSWQGDVLLDVWGVTTGRIRLPEKVAQGKPSLSRLLSPHIAPETFYLTHEAAATLNIDEDRSSRIEIDDGDVINVKKCSYCGRLLPLDPARAGSLSFHKHNAKRTGHQNECRACKKWRINDSFNPLRTVDQLHESSVITRERKLLLREPAILQRIKERSGAGLKSQVWERFGKRCFKCKRPLKLEEVQLDHTRPLAYLHPIDEHATCLCPECNNLKKERFPVDFYSDEQLKELAGICGLDYNVLKERTLNREELERLIARIVDFAREWEPRTFAATARKVKELDESIDLFEVLREAAPKEADLLKQRLRERPPAVGEEE
jgi:hypothetical protein